MTLADAVEITVQLQLVDTNLDTVLVQAEHLIRSVRVAPCVPIISQPVSTNRISHNSLFFVTSDCSATPNTKTTTEIGVRVNTLIDKDNL